MPRVVPFDFVVPGTPDDVASRLRAQTRFRLLPWTGTPLLPADVPLAGRVSPTGFTLTVNRRDLWTLTQPVASGRLEAVAGGTRIVGEAKLPRWLTGYLRLVFLAMLGGSAVLAAGSTVNPDLLVPGLALGFGSLVGTLGIGLNVANADALATPLVDALVQAAGAPQAEATGQRAAAPVRAGPAREHEPG